MAPLACTVVRCAVKLHALKRNVLSTHHHKHYWIMRYCMCVRNHEATQQTDQCRNALNSAEWFVMSIITDCVVSLSRKTVTSSILWLTSCVNKDRTTGEVEGQTCEPMITDDTISNPFTPDTSEPNTFYIKKDPDYIKMGEVASKHTIECIPNGEIIMGNIMLSTPEESDTIAVTIPATEPYAKDTIIHMIKGKVMMTDTISQKIKHKKK